MCAKAWGRNSSDYFERVSRMNRDDKLEVGQQVRCLCDIWQEREDVSNNDILAKQGDVLVVRGFFGAGACVSLLHQTITDRSFGALYKEIEVVKETNNDN